MYADYGEKQEEIMENTPNKKIKIFFADNSKEDLLSITKHFENLDDFEIMGAESDAGKTLEMLSNTKVDILVMDIMLGGMDGFEFMENNFVDIDELNLLANKLNCFDNREMQKFEAVVVKS